MDHELTTTSPHLVAEHARTTDSWLGPFAGRYVGLPESFD
jgi:hypothetical protein